MERPIIFSDKMIRALIDGRKTQTRRPLKEHPLEWLQDGFTPEFVAHPENYLCPYGYSGDRLWVRECFAVVPSTAYAHSEDVQQTIQPDDDYYAAIYRAGWSRSNGGFSWRPSIHMPRWASRIALEVLSARIERLNDISEADAKAEGVFLASASEAQGNTHRTEFAGLWESIYGPGAWDANPWVWVIEFRRADHD